MPTETSPPKRGRKPKQPAPVEPMQTTEQIVRISLTKLHPFHTAHPFKFPVVVSSSTPILPQHGRKN